MAHEDSVLLGEVAGTVSRLEKELLGNGQPGRIQRLEATVEEYGKILEIINQERAVVRTFGRLMAVMFSMTTLAEIAHWLGMFGGTHGKPQ